MLCRGNDVSSWKESEVLINQRRGSALVVYKHLSFSLIFYNIVLLSLVLVCSSYYNKYHMAYDQQTFISHHSRGWEVQDQDAGLGVWWRPASWFIDRQSSSYILTWGKKKRSSLESSFIRALTPFIRAICSWCNQLPQTPNSKVIILRVRINHINYGWT